MFGIAIPNGTREKFVCAYRYRRRSAQDDCMTFETWMESSSFCGLAPGWRRGSSTFSSRLGELRMHSSKPNAKILRSFCWMKGIGVWFGRIYFFASVSFNLHQELHAHCLCGSKFDYGIAAVRVFDKVKNNTAFGRRLRQFHVGWHRWSNCVGQSDIDTVEYPK